MIPNPIRLAALTVLWALSAAAPGLEERTYGNTRYLTGGIGQEEVQALREAAPRYNLKMIFTDASGEYLADVKVEVKNRAGEPVLAIVSEGPMVFASLPPGRYSVEASAEGRSLTRKVSVTNKGGRQLLLRWPQSSSQAATSPAAGR